MSARGILMEPAMEPAKTVTPPSLGLISVVVPVVERADDIMAVYRAFARELDERPEEYEFVFVFDGRFSPPSEMVALSRETDRVRILRFAREFGSDPPCLLPGAA